LLNSDFNRD